MSIQKLLQSVLCVCLAGMFAPVLHAQNGCSDANLSGKYVIHGGGKNVELNLLGLLRRRTSSMSAQDVLTAALT